MEDKHKDSILRVLTDTTLKFYILLAVLMAIAAWGIYVWALVQFSDGLGVTGMNYQTLWGIYIVNFALFIGLSAGGVIVAAAVHLFDIKRLKVVAMLSEYLAVVCLIVAVLSVFMDLGRPDRMFNLFIHFFERTESPLIWDFTIISSYFLATLVSIYLVSRTQMAKLIDIIPERAWLYKILTLGRTHKGESIREKKGLWLTALILLPLAVLLHSITAWLFALTKAQAGWHTAIMAPIFISSALTSGIALLIITALLVRKFMKVEISDAIIREMGKLLLIFIPLDFYLLFSEFLAHAYKHTQEVGSYTVFEAIMHGKFSFFFWTDMILGYVVPFLILLIIVAKKPRGSIAIPAITISSIFVIIGVAFKRLDIVIPSLQYRVLEFYPVGFYMPTWVEWSVLAGIWSIGIIVFLLMMKIIPLSTIKPHIAKHPDAQICGAPNTGTGTEKTKKSKKSKKDDKSR